MKKILIACLFLLPSCRHYKYFTNTEDKATLLHSLTQVTVACCPEIQDSTKALCARLLGPEGLHGEYPNVSHYIEENGNLYFPLVSVCDHADIK